MNNENKNQSNLITKIIKKVIKETFKAKGSLGKGKGFVKTSGIQISKEKIAIKEVKFMLTYDEYDIDLNADLPESSNLAMLAKLAFTGQGVFKLINLEGDLRTMEFKCEDVNFETVYDDIKYDVDIKTEIEKTEKQTETGEGFNTFSSTENKNETSEHPISDLLEEKNFKY